MRSMNVVEHHRRLCELVDVRRGIPVIPVATQMVCPKSINEHIKFRKAHLLICH